MDFLLLSQSLLWMEWTKALLCSQNLLVIEWISLSFSVSFIGVVVIYCSNVVPEGIQRVFKYGKAAELHVPSIKKLIHKIELPKRWFYHFYLFASTFYATLAWSMYQVYYLKRNIPNHVEILLDSWVGTARRATVMPESVIIAMILIIIQVTRRLCECIFLSVYSEAKMNIVHYVLGLLFYFGVGLSLLAEAPGFTGRGIAVSLNGHFFIWNHLVGTIIFFWASYIQYQSHAILAGMRKDNKGQVINYCHSIPRGGWFDSVSCPHYFAEILIYLSLCLILGGKSTTWWMVCCFVVLNQIIVGLVNHHWYQKTFKDYPKSRKAVLPLLV